MIEQNLQELRGQIADCARRAGRQPEDVTLVAVTKTVDVPHIRAAVACGAHDLGENRVQELVRKYDEIPDVRWHLIGQLQSNKIKYIIGKTALVHSLCTLSAAREMDRLCARDGGHVDCLVEVNVAQEDSKSGVTEQALPGFLEEIAGLGGVHVRGLMTVAPFVEDPEQVRWVFARLANVFAKLPARQGDAFEMKYLSMGMSGDFKVAIEEGANIVRVGTAIFGHRS